MKTLLALSVHHGYLLILAAVLGESLGLPIPAAIALVAGGAAAASHVLNLGVVLALALCSMLAGDVLLFTAGRYMGWGLLGVLCKVSINPESCILRSAESFYKRGKTALLFAKFIPGVNTMAPPLAGSMKMPLTQFLRLDAAGAALYSVVYIAAGFIFRDFVAAISRGMLAASRVLEMFLLAAFVAYVAYRVWVFCKHSAYGTVTRVRVQELAERLASGAKDDIVIVDVRSHGYYDAYAARIAGSIRIEPNNLLEEVKSLPKNKEIYIYCT